MNTVSILCAPHILLFTLLLPITTFGFSFTPEKTSNFDRFIVSCPADPKCISQFEPSLITDDETKETSGSIWAAAYRSNNNLPSVFLRDELFSSMKLATTTTTAAAKIEQSSTQSSNILSANTTPVAVARLRLDDDGDNTSWILDCMRCTLKKETTNPNCDGGSEHTEAISVCIDELLIHHLTKHNPNPKAVKCKATLVSGPLLEARGFETVSKLNKGMASHVSDWDESMSCYAGRVADVANVAAKSPGARDRALEILGLLGQLKEEEGGKKKEDDGPEDDYDPWAGVKQFL